MTLINSIFLFVQGYYAVLLLVIVVLALALIRLAYLAGLKKSAKNIIPVPENNTQNLPASPQQLNALINSLNDIIFEFDEHKVCLNVWFNPFTERVVDPNEALGKKLEDILGVEKALKFNNALDYVITTRKPTSVEYISDYGTGKWLVAKLAPVFDREGNYTSRISASVSDISEQKMYAEALKENEALLIEAQSVAKIGNWWYDDETKESYWSESLFAILEVDEIPEGLSKLEYYMSLVHPDDREGYNRFISDLHTSKQKKYEHRLITLSGKLKYIKVTKGDLALTDTGNVKRIFGIIQDITETKLSEKAIKKSRLELIEAQTIAKIGNWRWDTAMHKMSWSEEIRHIFEVDPGILANLGIKRFLLTYVH